MTWMAENLYRLTNGGTEEKEEGHLMPPPKSIKDARGAAFEIQNLNHISVQLWSFPETLIGGFQQALKPDMIIVKTILNN